MNPFRGSPAHHPCRMLQALHQGSRWKPSLHADQYAELGSAGSPRPLWKLKRQSKEGESLEGVCTASLMTDEPMLVCQTMERSGTRRHKALGKHYSITGETSGSPLTHNVAGGPLAAQNYDILGGTCIPPQSWSKLLAAFIPEHKSVHYVIGAKTSAGEGKTNQSGDVCAKMFKAYR